MMEKKFEIYNYKKEDYPALFEFLKKLDKEFVPPLSKRRKLEDYISREFVNPNVTLIAKDKKKIIGYINMELDKPLEEECNINTVGVAKKYREANLATNLVERLFVIAQQENYKTVKVRTWSTNHASIGLYKKLGFVTDYVVENDRGENINSIYFKKEIGLLTVQ